MYVLVDIDLIFPWNAQGIAEIAFVNVRRARHSADTNEAGQ